MVSDSGWAIEVFRSASHTLQFFPNHRHQISQYVVGLFQPPSLLWAYKGSAQTNTTIVDPIIPPPCQIPSAPKIQPPTTPPSIPRMISTRTPYPPPFMTCPASQPAMSPTTIHARMPISLPPHSSSDW